MTDPQPKAGETILRLNDIRKVYGDHVALGGVSLDVKRGEVVAIIGPSGSGKRTLRRRVNQLEVPDPGSLEGLGSKIHFGRRVSASVLPGLRRQGGMGLRSFSRFLP